MVRRRNLRSTPTLSRHPFPCPGTSTTTSYSWTNPSLKVSCRARPAPPRHFSLDTERITFKINRSKFSRTFFFFGLFFRKSSHRRSKCQENHSKFRRELQERSFLQCLIIHEDLSRIIFIFTQIETFNFNGIVLSTVIQIAVFTTLVIIVIFSCRSVIIMLHVRKYV